MELFASDLDEILERSESDFRNLVDMNLFITGGTGFVGSWLTLSWLHAKQVLKGSGRLTVLVRDQNRLKAVLGGQASRVTPVIGDIRRFSLGDSNAPDLVIHAATPARETLNVGRPNEMLEIIVDGQKNLVRQLAEHPGSRILFTSSGAVYGKLPQEDGPVTEDHPGGPNPLDPRSAYHEGKRVAELLLSFAHQENLVDPLIARLFAFVGPLLPLNEHFAIGNFLRDALKQQPIHLTGDGSPVRSYQYPTDMAVWLWAIAARGEPVRAYNVGSANGLSLRQVATAVSQNSEGCPVTVAGERNPKIPVDYYVPDVNRARAELGLENLVDLDEAIRRTLKWHKQHAI